MPPPGSPFHLSQARHNYKAYELLRGNGFVDWATTALLYTVLHCANQWLSKELEYIPRSHDALEKALVKCAPREVYRSYRVLFDLCHLARYREWEGQLDARRLDECHASQYADVVRFFDAPKEIRPA